MAADQISMVKALRQKCDDLEDEVDAANAAKEAAEESSEKLQSEIEALRTQLEGAGKEADDDKPGSKSADADSATNGAVVKDLESRVEELTKQLETERAEHAEQTSVSHQNAADEKVTASAAGEAVVKDLESRVEELTKQLDTERTEHDEQLKVSQSNAAEEKSTHDELAAANSASLVKELEGRVEILTKDMETERAEHALKLKAPTGNTDDSSTSDLQEQLDKLVKSHEAELSAVRDELSSMQAERDGHAEKLQGVETGLRDKDSELEDARQTSKELRGNAAQHEERLKEAEEERDELDGERQTLVGRLTKLGTQLEASKGEHATLVAKLTEEEQMTQALTDEIARLKEEHAGRDADRDLELEKRHHMNSELESTVKRLHEEMQQQASAVAAAPCTTDLEERLAGAEAALAEQIKTHDEALERAHTNSSAATGESHREIQRLSADLDAQRKQNKDLESRIEATADAHRRSQDQLGGATEAHDAERKRGDEMKGDLDAMQDAHEALFTKYSRALEDLDSSKSINKRHEVEKGEVQAALDEEQRLRKEREAEPPKGPSQLSVSDVLIAVNFEGVVAPLEIRPWDTDTQAVVHAWLISVQRSSKLQPSIVRYVKHLEETAEAFPVREDAKLLDVHEQYAV